MHCPTKSPFSRFGLLAFVAAILATSLAVDGEPSKAKTFEIPYRVPPTQHVMVRVKINGEGPFNLILDTGAPLVILAKKVATQAKIDAGDGSATIDRLEIEG